MSNRARLYILGASGHGAVLSDIAVLLGYREIVFCDDDPRKHGQTILGYPVVGDRTAVPWGADLAVGIGMNAVRGKVVAQAAERGWRLPVLVHPGAIVSPSATIGAGTVVMANVVVNARIAIGPGCILNTSCSVDHDCTLGSLVHIAPGVRLSGGCYGRRRGDAWNRQLRDSGGQHWGKLGSWGGINRRTRHPVRRNRVRYSGKGCEAT